MKINIFIPTYKRADVLVGKDYFKSARYVLPEGQRDDYRKTLPAKRMIVMPDEFDGNICRKQNWMLDNLERPYVKVDDDVECIGYFEGRTGMKTGDHRRKILDPLLFDGWARQSFDMAEQFGAKMWGIAQNEDNRIFKEFHPISLRLPVLGPFNAHLGHDLKYDERMGTKDDYDMSLQQLNKYKIIFRWNKFHYICGHGTNPGGLIGYRTRELETKYCKAIMKKWGKHIIKYKLPGEKMADLLNGIVNIPIKGV